MVAGTSNSSQITNTFHEIYRFLHDESNTNAITSVRGGIGNNGVKTDDGLLPNRKQTLSASAVKFWRLIVLGVLTIFMIITSVANYNFTAQQEHENFETNFYNDADKVINSLSSRIEFKLGIVDLWLINVMSYSKYTNQAWPFVNIANFSVRVNKMCSLSRSIVIRISPFVTTQQRDEYENYVASVNSWVNESIIVQTMDDTNHALPIDGNSYNVCNVIYGDDEQTKPVSQRCLLGTNRTNPPFYVPIRQMAPMPAHYPPYNYDLMSRSYNRKVIETVMNSRAVLSRAHLVPNETDLTHYYENALDAPYYSNFIRRELNPWEPLSHIYYPVTKRLDSVRPVVAFSESSTTDTGTCPVSATTVANDIVAVVVMSFYWRDTIKDILPSNSDALIAVFENPCNPTFTYLINGSNVIFLGSGDLHKPKYDYMVRTLSFTKLTVCSMNSSSYTGFPLDSQHCPFTLKLYPSDLQKAHYITNNPVYAATIAVVIFTFTSSVFMIYNYWVERRQRQIMQCAIESTINVNELENIVRNRTLKLQQINHQLEVANEKIRKASLLQLEHFACMSHEIRTPLNGINGLSTVVRDDIRRLMNVNDDTKIDGRTMKDALMASLDLIDGIASSGELLRRIVDDVLDFAKLGSGKVEIDIQAKTSLQDILDAVLKSVQVLESVVSKKLTIKTYYDFRVNPYVSTDSRRLKQILFNLISNAVKYSRSQGIIELHVLIENNHNGDTKDDIVNVLRFVVKDYGSGIPRHKFQAIFEPFIQADDDASDVKHTGTGLGLAITSRLVHALQGFITVDSEVGKWTKFQVDFPLTGNKNDEVLVRSISESLQKKMIWFVDDSFDDRTQMNAIFKEYKLNYMSFISLMDIRKHLHEGGHSKVDALLLRDDMVDYDSINYLNGIIKPNIILFRSNQTSQPTSCDRLGPLVRMLPSVLMTNIIDNIREGRTRDRPNASLINTEDAFSHLRVLVAEDNKINQKVIVRFMKKLGVDNVVVVENGKLAVEREGIEAFDIILMDMHMPVMDGVTACKLILEREDPTIKHDKPKIVFLTAHVSDGSKKQCLDAGAVDYLSKPCRVEDITTCFRNIITGSVHNTDSNDNLISL